jgi:hypothetical protein
MGVDGRQASQLPHLADCHLGLTGRRGSDWLVLEEQLDAQLCVRVEGAWRCFLCYAARSPYARC